MALIEHLRGRLYHRGSRTDWMVNCPRYQAAPFRTGLRGLTFLVRDRLQSEFNFTAADGLLYRTPARNFSSFAVFVEGSRDPDIWRFISRHLQPGDVFVDVGANIGTYSLPAARLVGPNGRVISFEPTPRIFACLQTGIAANGLTQVTAVQAALGETRGEVEMNFRSDNPGETHISTEGIGTTRVPLLPLDEALADLGVTRVDYLKIDVEGFEEMVLRGARETILGNPRIVVQTELIARHAARYGRDVGKVGELLREYGLAPHSVSADGTSMPINGPLPSDVIWFKRDLVGG